MMDDSGQEVELCRVCRLEGKQEQPLFNPCICSGSMKYIHLECLENWMRYSRREFCEVCKYRFVFKPVYAPDMPQQLAQQSLIMDVVTIIARKVLTSIKMCLHFILVAGAWCYVLPFVAYNIVYALFEFGFFDTLTLTSIQTWPLDDEDLVCGYIFIVGAVLAFVVVVLLENKILNDGAGPDWLPVGRPINRQPPDILLPPVRGENPVGELNPVVRQEIVNHGEEACWHWDRDNFSWGRFFGIDGSLVFIGYIFLVVLMYLLSVLTFAILPFQIGSLAIYTMALQDLVAATHFEGLVRTYCGYCIILIMLLIMYTCMTVLKFKRIIGLCYLIVKVFLLFVARICVMPLLFGWWLDVCSFSLFNTSFEEKLANFHLAPSTSMFIHWLVGIAFTNIFRSFRLLFKGVFRPNVLPFSVDENDVDIIEDLLKKDFLQHGQDFIRLLMLHGSVIFLVIWLPIEICKFLWPSILPYTVLQFKSTKQFCVEQLLLQIGSLILFEVTYTRNWLRSCVLHWCVIVSSLLGVLSCLNFDDGKKPTVAVVSLHEPRVNPEAIDEDLLHVRPNGFSIRIAALLASAALSAVLVSLAIVSGPAWLAYLAVSLWSAIALVLLASFQCIRLIAVCGAVFLGCVLVRAVCVIKRWLKGINVLGKLKIWPKIVIQILLTVFVVIGVIPFLSGVLLKLAISVPLLVPLHQTPILWTCQDWYTGYEYFHIVTSCIAVGPNWYAKRTIMDVYRIGILQFDLKLIFQRLAVPMIKILSLSIAVPHVIAYSIVPLIVEDESLKLLIAGRIYPTLMSVVIVIKCMTPRKFERLYNHMKHNKYLLGRTLENYTPKTYQYVCKFCKTENKFVH